jgi:hypothetical protein
MPASSAWVVALDIIALMDALNIKSAIIGRFDGHRRVVTCAKLEHFCENTYIT